MRTDHRGFPRRVLPAWEVQLRGSQTVFLVSYVERSTRPSLPVIDAAIDGLNALTDGLVDEAGKTIQTVLRTAGATGKP